jgi:hypothetical protein
MTKGRHHYVPQFYLRAFSTTGKQIHLYNLKHRQAVQDAPLRDQCYGYHLHGKTDEYEDALSKVENTLAPVLRRVVVASCLPKRLSDDHGLLYVFVVTQMLRTVKSAGMVNMTMDKMTKEAFKDESSLAGMYLDSIRVGVENPVVYSLQHMTPVMVEGLSDMEMHLVCARGDQTFITSDNPVFKYNQYLQIIKGYGVTGSITRGLQLFVPLSPKHLLMLYDGTVYKVDNTRKVLDSDITKLNGFQVYNAAENLYFSDWTHSPYVEYLMQRFTKFRIEDPIQVDEFVDPENEHHMLIAEHERMPNFGLRLSFASVLPHAARLSIPERLSTEYRYRRNPSGMASMPKPPDPPPWNGPVTFVRPKKKSPRHKSE